MPHLQHPSTTRRNALADLNQGWLRQALDLLERIECKHFSSPPDGVGPHRVCGHLRHVIEFYECFLDGVASSRIDYDGRKRDLSIESSPEAAAARIRSLIARLDSEVAAMEPGRTVFTRAEDADGFGLRDSYLRSSVGRELMALSSHTIHHFALIAMALRAHGMSLDPDFGMAPSTLRNQNRRLVKAA